MTIPKNTLASRAAAILVLADDRLAWLRLVIAAVEQSAHAQVGREVVLQRR